MTHPYLSLTDRDREEMLAAIGVSSVEDLFREIPESVRFRGRLELEPPLSEPELVEHLEELAARNLDTGVEEVRRIKEQGPRRRLVPFVMEERAIPRQGMSIVEGGKVTSGSHSPMLDRGIGMGYVDAALARPGQELTIDVRGRERRARVVERPIYKREERASGGG